MKTTDIREKADKLQSDIEYLIKQFKKEVGECDIDIYYEYDEYEKIRVSINI